MALYFSDRAALERLDFVPAAPGALNALPTAVELELTVPVVGATVKVSSKKWFAPRGLRDEILQHARRRGEVARRDAATVPLGAFVDLDLEDIRLGTVKVASVGGARTPFWVFLLVATVPSRGATPPVKVIGVGSADNFEAFAHRGAVEPVAGEWYPSSPEGRAMLYEKIGILSRNQVERELAMFGETYPVNFEPGQQISLFRDLIGALQHNDLTGDIRIGPFRPVPAGALLGVVEDVESAEGRPPTVLVRLIHLEQRSLIGS